MKDVILDKVKRMALCMQRQPWEQGCIAQAFLELGDERTAILMAKEAQLRQIHDGRVAVIGKAITVTDPCSIGEVLIFAYEKTGDIVFKESYEKLLNWALLLAPRSSNGLVYHIQGMTEIWADSFYMLPPFLAAAGAYDEAIKQLDGYWDHLYIKEKGLLGHKWDCEANKFTRGCLWGEGNGWALAGMARVIKMLPKSYEVERKRFIVRTKGLIDTLLNYKREDDFFHNAVDDGNTPVENGLTQLLTYALFRGVSDQWLGTDYVAIAEKLYVSVQHKVNEYGLVEDVCSAKTDFVTPTPNAEGQAFYIMMSGARNSYYDL